MKKLVLAIAVSLVTLNSFSQDIVLTVKGVSITVSYKEQLAFIDSIKKIHPDSIQKRFIRCLNKYRISNSLSVVKENTNNTKAAAFIAEYNLSKINTSKLSHTTNIKGCETLTDRVRQFNIKQTTNLVGENLLTYEDEFAFFYFKSNKLTYEQAFLKAWIESLGHKQNLLISTANEIGFIYMRSNDNIIIAAMVIN